MSCKRKKELYFAFFVGVCFCGTVMDMVALTSKICHKASDYTLNFDNLLAWPKVSVVCIENIRKMVMGSYVFFSACNTPKPQGIEDYFLGRGCWIKFEILLELFMR